MKILIHLNLIIFLLGTIACNRGEGDPSIINETELAVGDMALSDNGSDFTFTFKDVLEDSRCPSEVTCFWEGRIVLEFLATENSDTATIILATENSRDGDSLLDGQFKQHTFRLLEVNPYPKSAAIPKEDIRAKIKFGSN